MRKTWPAKESGLWKLSRKFVWEGIFRRGCREKIASYALVWANGVGSILKSWGGKWQYWRDIKWRGWVVCLKYLHWHIIARREGMGRVGKERECKCWKEGESLWKWRCNFVCVNVWVCVCVCASVYVVTRQQSQGSNFNLVSLVNILVISSECVSLFPHSTPPPPPPWDLLPYPMCTCVLLFVHTSLLHSLSLSFNWILLSISLCLPPTYLLLRFVENTPTLPPELATISELPTLCGWQCFFSNKT